MVEPGGNRAAMVAVPGGDFLGDGLERGEVGGGVAIAEGVIGDGFLPAAEQGGEVSVHGNQRVRAM